MDYWIDIDVYGIDGFDVRLSYTYEDIPIRDMWDNEYDNVEEMQRKVDNYDAYWIIGRAQVFLGGVEIGGSTLGGIYVDTIEDFVKEFKDDLVYEAMDEAKLWVKKNLEKLNSIGV